MQAVPGRVGVEIVQVPARRSAIACLRPYAERVLRAYARVLFCDSPWIGAWFAALTFWSPPAAIAGLVGIVAALAWSSLLSIDTPGEPQLLNALLLGLFLGAFFRFDAVLLGWIVVTALLVTLTSAWLSAALWRNGRLPALSLPFVLATWFVILASQSVGSAGLVAIATTPPAITIFAGPLDDFFIALGWLYLLPDPRIGALIFAGLVIASRYLALLAVAGYVVGALTLHWLGRPDAGAVGFNFMLSAMALGGIFATPSRASFALALGGATTAACLGVALGVLLQPLHLPLVTLPFLVAVYLWFGGLGVRDRSRPPALNLETPQAPEIAFERARLAEARGARADSVALVAPLYGEWRITQAFDGPHTHQAPWQHALDFELFEDERNARGDGRANEDYFGFGAPVIAPAAGQIARVRDDLPDRPPGAIDTVNNWGNYAQIRLASGQLVLLAHLKQGSVTVRAGEWVAAGQPIAACGSSGRSPEPHVHLHVQTSERLGSPTVPFHLVNTLVRTSTRDREFRLGHRPAQGEWIAGAPRDERVGAALRVLPGQVLHYRVTDSAHAGESDATLRGELTLLGQPRLVGASGASAAYEETYAVIGFYDRSGPRDSLLDLWMLALGLTPLCAAADEWADRPAIRLMPLDAVSRALTALLRPLGGGSESRYRRRFDPTANCWIQDGTHQVRLAPGLEWTATTRARFDPAGAVRQLELQCDGRRIDAVFVNRESSSIE